jgi:lycopene cyclase domain-containing protein
MTYLALNAAFLLAVAAIVAVAVLRFRRRGGGIRWRAAALAGAALLLLTAVFDNVLIAIGLVGYDPERISGLRIGVAPIEDFAYALAAVLLLPALWHLAARRDPDAAEPDA